MRAAVLILLAVAAGCASAPGEAPVETAIAPPAATPADALPPEHAAATEPATAKAEPQGEKTVQFKPPPGFKPKIDGWEVVYCKKMPILGSRFPKQVCMTEAELKEHMAANDTMKRDKDQVSRVCSGACAVF